MPIRLLLADDHVIVRNGIKNLLIDEGFEIVAETDNGRQAIELSAQQQPDVVVLDISMPLLNGIDAARAIHAASPRSKVVLLTMYKQEQFALEALRAGVDGYVLKTQATRDLVQAIRTALAGETYLSPAISQTVVSMALNKTNSNSITMSPREREVLRLIADSKSNKEIAQELGISVKSVESHRGNWMKKLDLHSVAGLVRYAINIGLIQP